jgi:nicotinate dehydrogenase subunit A
VGKGDAIDCYELTVNGETRSVDGEPDATLLHALRGELGLTGTRFGCGAAMCGACFVLLDGRPVPSCDTPLWSAAGREVTTVEGLAAGDALHPAGDALDAAAGGALHPVQEAFLAEQAGQCGYCLSGILITAVALLAENPHPDEPTVAAALDRHLCRCGAHQRMIRAVMRASGEGA